MAIDGQGIGATPLVELSVAGSENIEAKFTKFEWMSFVNGGYVVRGKVDDSWWNIISDIATNFYLKDSRKKAVPITFSIKYDKNRKTATRTAILTELESDGQFNRGNVTFVGVDPPSFLLNSGDAGGGYFKGKASDAIKQAVAKYAPEIKLEITETQDDPNNYWWMMRQDPKTFIGSILDWSASITPDKTSWIVASGEISDGSKVVPKLVIKEQSGFKGKFIGYYDMNTSKGVKNIEDVTFLGDSMITPLQTNIRTAGISTISGLMISTAVNDDNTGNKRNVPIGPNQGTAKPSSAVDAGSVGGATYIAAIPELSGGELGVSYANYIDGRARGTFMNMLNMVMRIRITVMGDHTIDDSELLGVSSLNINWTKTGDSEVYFIGGRWLVYGFHHDVSRAKWVTHLYLARLDYDANAKPVTDLAAAFNRQPEV